MTNQEQPWYEALFTNYANTYEKECFTQGTVGECDFIQQELNHNKQAKILDVGCGAGRHAIELATRGYTNITGIDLSASMLNKAREKAQEAKVNITFKQHDARKPHFNNEFDAVIMMCEGGFSLMETDEMNYEILKNASLALKQDRGKIIFTTLNGLFPLFHSVKEFFDAQKNEATTQYTENTFDLMTFRDHNTTTIVDDSGQELRLKCNERYYVPSEITWLLKTLGFSIIDIYGAKLGAFSRADALTTEDYEMLVIAEKEKKMIQ